MSRVDELTLKLIDGSITAAERTELERLVAASPETEKAHGAMLDLVAALRGQGPVPDVARETLDRIHARITEKIEVGVMDKIRVRRTERASGRRIAAPRRRGAWIAGLAATAAAAIVLVVVLAPSGSDPGQARVMPPKRVEPKPEPPASERPVSPPPSPLPKSEPPAPIPPPEPGPPVPPPVEERKPEPKPGPKPEPVPAPEVPKPTPPSETLVVAATLEKTEGASVLVKGAKKAAKAGQDILEGQGLEADGPSTVKYADGTRLDLRAKTVLREFMVKNGKAVDLARGILMVQAADQPADRPMVITTPVAEIRVVGTGFRVSVDPDADGATQVDVLEGKVRVKRAADGKILDVTKGGLLTVVKGAGALAAQAHTGLVAHWKFDEAGGTKALDSSGNLLHGEPRGETSWVPGRLGSGLRIGPGGFFQVPGFKVPEAFTASFWVYQAKLDTEQDWFVNFGGDFMLMREGNMDRRQLRTGFENPQDFLTIASAIQPGQWTHVAVTYDGSEVRVFSNGSSGGAKKMGRRDIRAGATFGRMAAASEGILDDLRVYDRALPASDIQRIMAGAHPVPPPRK